MIEKVPPNDALNESSTKPQKEKHPPKLEGTAYCDRCNQPMFRMRAVYWCINCGYKTDCCGH